MAASSSSSSGPGWKYGVFLNFNQEDTHTGFVCHLYEALRQKSIDTFVSTEGVSDFDDESSEDDDLSEPLIAIPESKLLLVVFSQNYASSTRCLKELEEILQCNHTEKQIMVPIFYQVDPSDVRKLRGSFDLAFDRHDTEMDEVRSWRSAFTKAADICGWVLRHFGFEAKARQSWWRSALTEAADFSGWVSRDFGDDAELIEKIVEDVYGKLSHISPASIEYDVFINFRGEDTRRGFVSHLYRALHQNSINTYIDAKALRKGDPLSELQTAARESKISLLVFSENYVSSTWCLKELVEIVESRDTKNQIVIPIFYKVNPSEVRKLRKSLAEAYAKHDMGEVQSWGSALTSGTDMDGWDSQYYLDDDELIKDIVEDVSRKLIRIVSTSSKYDVFISFRGVDTGTLVNRLYRALRQKSINTYIDAEVSERLIAARESKISLIILSENYASSSWCLKELVEIVESSYANNQIMLPIFYKVKPSDVHTPRGSFAVAFAKHHKYSSAEMGVVQSWLFALASASKLSGWVSHPNETDAKLIENIVEDVSRKLIRIASTSSKSNGLIEMDSHKHEMHLLLHPPGVETNDVRVVGICGTGGIGKTTVARAVYDEIADRFEAACFLENVKEGSMKLSKLHMQAQLLESILDNKGTADRFEASRFLENVESYPEFYKIRMQAQLQQSILGHKVGSSYISNKSFQMMLERIGKRKVLVVVDNVDKVAQIEALLGKQHSFGGGSKIIITTRDAQLLNGVDAIYKPKTFSDHGALELFRRYAFKTNQPTTDYDDLSRRVIQYAQGLPLALKVLGAFFYNKTIHEWEDVLEKLRKIPERKIHDVLKTSFDGLDDITKDFFLDIACFFRGMNVDSAVKIMGEYGMIGIHPCTAIRVLMDRALITVSRWGDLEMHDSLEEMGRELVRQKSLKEPEKQRKLRRYEDVDLEKSPHDISFLFGRMPLVPMSLVPTDAKAVYAIIERSW